MTRLAIALVLALALILLCIVAGGCATAERPAPIAWSKDLKYAADAWAAEAQRHLHRPVLVFACHGGPGLNGRWVCTPDDGGDVPVESVVWLIRRTYDGPLVLVVCNRAHSELHAPGVWFARDLVWATPGDDTRRGTDGKPQFGVGRFAEFAEGR